MGREHFVAFIGNLVDLGDKRHIFGLITAHLRRQRVRLLAARIETWKIRLADIY